MSDVYPRATSLKMSPRLAPNRSISLIVVADRYLSYKAWTLEPGSFGFLGSTLQGASIVIKWSSNADRGGGAAPGLGRGRFPPSEAFFDFLRGFFSSTSGGNSQPISAASFSLTKAAVSFSFSANLLFRSRSSASALASRNALNSEASSTNVAQPYDDA